MEWLLPKVERFFAVLFSYIRAVLRLLVWQVLMFFSGLQQIFFMRTEVVGVELKGLPLLCDREDLDDKLSMMEKLCIENPDLMGISGEMPDDIDYPMDDSEDE